jgi:hypothetical protein
MHASALKVRGSVPKNIPELPERKIILFGTK